MVLSMGGSKRIAPGSCGESCGDNEQRDGACANVHDSQIEASGVPGNLATSVDRDFLPGDWVNANLPGEEKKVLIPKKKFEDVGIFEEKATLFRNGDGEWSEIELLLIDIGVGKVSVDGA